MAMDYGARIHDLQAAILVAKAQHRNTALLYYRLERTRTKQLKSERREEKKRAKELSLLARCSPE